jgi:hypothetical protein
LSRSSIHLFYSSEKWEIHRLSGGAVATVAAHAGDTLRAYKVDAGWRIYFSGAVKAGLWNFSPPKGPTRVYPAMAGSL